MCSGCVEQFEHCGGIGVGRLRFLKVFASFTFVHVVLNIIVRLVHCVEGDTPLFLVLCMAVANSLAVMVISPSFRYVE